MVEKKIAYGNYRTITAILVVWGVLPILFGNWILKLYGASALLVAFVYYKYRTAHNKFWANAIVYYILFGLALYIAFYGQNLSDLIIV